MSFVQRLMGEQKDPSNLPTYLKTLDHAMPRSCEARSRFKISSAISAEVERKNSRVLQVSDIIIQKPIDGDLKVSSGSHRGPSDSHVIIRGCRE
jgi:hypothetical protein